MLLEWIHSNNLQKQRTKNTKRLAPGIEADIGQFPKNTQSFAQLTQESSFRKLSKSFSSRTFSKTLIYQTKQKRI